MTCAWPSRARAARARSCIPSSRASRKLAALYHRTSARVLWDVLETPARLEPLFADVLAIATSDCGALPLGRRASVRLRARRCKSSPRASAQIIGTVKNALNRGRAAQRACMFRSIPETPNIVFSVRLDEGTMRVSVDLAGRPMNQRGYRNDVVQRHCVEDLAAVLLMLSRLRCTQRHLD